MYLTSKLINLSSIEIQDVQGGVTEGGCIVLPFPFPAGGNGPYNPIPEDTDF